MSPNRRLAIFFGVVFYKRFDASLSQYLHLIENTIFNLEENVHRRLVMNSEVNAPSIL